MEESKTYICKILIMKNLITGIFQFNGFYLAKLLLKDDFKVHDSLAINKKYKIFYIKLSSNRWFCVIDGI